jgi:hypothetical protein
MEPANSTAATGSRAVYLAFRCAMDVVVKPTGSAGTYWTLEDRLGRSLGAIFHYRPSGSFVIAAKGALFGIPPLHATLDDAMNAIAQKTHGTCELDSRD